MNWLTENGIQVVLWISTVVALTGAYYNATMRCKLSYVLWFLSNFVFLWHNFRIGEKQQCILYIFYFLLAIIGVKNTIHQKGWFNRVSVDR